MKKKSLNERLADREKVLNAPPDQGKPSGWRRLVTPDTDKEHDHDHHSRAFRRHFKDHAEYLVEDEDGHTEVVRVYLGTWYIPSLSEDERKKERGLLLLLFAISVVLFLIAVFQTVPANRFWFVSVTQVAAIAAFAYTGFGLANYLPAGSRLTVTEYEKGSVRFRIGSISAGVVLILYSLLYMICAVLFRGVAGSLFLCAILTLGSAFSILFANRLHSKVTFTEEKSKETVPDGAQRIE